MTTVSQRAERLDVIRDLVVLGVQRDIRQRSELHKAAIEAQILVNRKDEPLDYTSVYRFFDALRFLELDISEEYDIEGNIVWSPSAIELARYGAANYRSYALSDIEKAIFRDKIFLSDASKQFLSYFCEGNIVPRSQEQFLACARPLYVINISAKRPISVEEGNNEWPAKDNVEISTNPDSIEIARRPTKEFLYTYRYWCLDVDIVDELNIEEAERCGIPRSRSYVLFPLDPTVYVTADQFLRLIYLSLGHRLRQPQVVPIPWLLYQICPENRISVETFKRLLLETWRQNRHLLHLERGPGRLIRGTFHSSYHEYSERYRNRRYYLVVDGTIRSNLAILPRTSQGG